MSSNQEANDVTLSETNDVTLSVEFAGVCLHVIHREREFVPGEKPPPTFQVSVLMPTCVPTADGRVNTKHEDGDIGARHVPYLLMDLANLDVDQRVMPGLVADGPRFQVVRRLSREELFLKPEEPQGSIIELKPDPLPLPDLSLYKGAIRLKDLLSEIPRFERPELNVRMVLKGGTLAAVPLGGSDEGGRRPVGGSIKAEERSQKPDWDKNPEDWAGSIIWTRDIKKDSLPEGFLEIGIRSFDSDKPNPPLRLRPVTRSDGKEVIQLKIANLCETNPLEWKEFEHKLQKDDVDGKWVFRLFEAVNGVSLLKAIRRDKRPYPKLSPRAPRSTGSAGCTNFQHGLP